MIKKIVLVVTIISFLSFTLVSNFRELVIEKLANYTDNYPEKIYVQTDKPYYAAGDDIWYTAYLVNGTSHRKSNISNVIYVELINDQDSVLLKKQLYTNDLSANGDFKTRKNWKPGNYSLRAYTNYMRNNGTDYFFQTKIPIWNISEKPLLIDDNIKLTEIETIKASSNRPPEIGFYPEGGYLVNNLSSKIGIKVKNIINDNFKLTGTIKDSNHKIIMSFETYKFGLSAIKLTPEPNKTYYASIIHNDKEIKYPLPKALPNGYNLDIINSGKQILLQVSSNTSIGLRNTFLVAHQRGKLVYEKLEREDKSTYKIRIDTKFLLDGVTCFTLFDGDGKPVCERLVYIDNPENSINVNMEIDNPLPKTRDKISMQLDLTDKIGNAAFGNLSMSITDIDAIEHNTKSENIKTYLLLNSDLRGHIEDPGYFFEKENDYRRRFLLDLLMLTHGWRRFSWENILYKNNYKNLEFEPEKGIYISGYTAQSTGLKKQTSAATRLTFIGNPPYQTKQQSNINGVFKYGPFIFKDTISTLIEARVKDFKSDNDKNNRFISINLHDQLANSPEVKSGSINTILKNSIIDSTKINSFLKQAEKISKLDSEYLKATTLLDEIIITAQKKSEEDKREEELDSRTLHGSPNRRLDLSKYENQRFFNIIDLINQLPGVTAFNDSISIRNQGTPQILLDGIVVGIEGILFLTGVDIDFIDVLDGAEAAMYSNSSNGVIAIYSRTGNFSSTSNVKRKPGIIDFTATGFYSGREFYAPNHLDTFEDATKPDIRTTLHWEPKIILSETSNKAEISFFTSDSKSNYAIKIEGVTDTGIPVYHLSTFEVD
ncbi:MAG: hypothetical protein P8K68_02360 [Algibacter sp.]|uniref:hypothetical protein n=1 Tax=Algibacter sp. TaxID=1872428 RepID=UPI00262E91DC|nr:hypothetical protein [Algibacter sp.]MDG1730662.1 hypothetical protein [Algibacter sp.]MDG2177613.1 hypothetical protein [Algibacter sp.]